VASITINLGPEQADKFLTRLAEDDAYRQQLRDDPNGALGEYGIAVSGDLMPRLRELPPKEAIQRVRDSELSYPPDYVSRWPLGECVAYATAILVQSLGKPPPDA